MTRKHFFLLLLIFMITALVVTPDGTTRAQAGTASELIVAVNQLRAQYGMFPLEPHSVLSAVAQAHSQYQASIQSSTHIGPGGTRVKDRLRAAGFCSGNTFFASENVAGGYNLSINKTIYTYWADPDHMNTMLSGWGSEYTHIGAGAAKNGDYVAYTVIAAVCSSYPAPTDPPGGGTGGATTTAIPVVKNTPGPDGSVIHIVKPGQTLWTISVVYDVDLEKIMKLNGFNENTFLYPGDEVIIKPGKTLTPSPTMEITATPEATRTPTRTASPQESDTVNLSDPIPSPTLTATPLEAPSLKTENPALIIISIVLSAGAILMVFIRSFRQSI
jgi:LysM repeat protein